MLDAESSSPGPAPFACAYINGRADSIPPLLLALDGLSDVASLLEAATSALRRGGIKVEPKIVYTPDGVIIAKAARVSEIRPNSVLVLSCGEPFDPKSVPERARRMHATNQKQAQQLSPLVRAEQHDMLDEIPSKAPPPSRAPPPWKFSPSGRWASPLAQRSYYRA